jgi:2,5-dihydroxypyridine 5,6-dioxygenase
MPISDDHRLSVWREVLQLCRVKAGENVVVLTGEGSLAQNVDMAMRASAAMGAKVCRVDVPPSAIGGGFGSRASVEVTPLTGHRLVVDTLKQADMVLDLMGLLHSPEQLEILAAQTRMLMVIEPPEMLARMIPTADDKRRVQAAGKLLKAAQQMHVTSKAGTDLRMGVGQFPTLLQWGYSDEPGHWDHWPSAFVAT